MKDKHIDAFIQETKELLEVLESSLLQLESQPNDEELIGKVFRSLHTIKGAGGMFGFDNVATFVHDIETVYDRIRSGQLEVNKNLIDITLKACDKISLMINNENDDGLDSNENLLLSFKEYLGNSKIVTEEEKLSIAPEEDNTKEKAVYHIFFEPSEDLFLKGTKPHALIKELIELGEAFIIPGTERIPLLNNIDPEKLYTSWDIILASAKGINVLKDVFIFVEDDCKINIKVIDKGELKGNKEYYKKIITGNNGENNPEPEINNHNNSTTFQDKHKSEKTKKTPAKESIFNIRVSSDKLDLLVNLVGELVTVQARLSQIAGKYNNAGLESVSEDVERLTWELRENALSIRMLPIGSTFNKFNRLVRDLSKDLGKEVELITEGGETELDKNVIEKLNDPLVHIIRNCIDHGIEKPEIRLKKNKDRTGKVFLSAIHSGTHVLIQIRDDGAGLNKKAIYEKAIRQGIISEGDDLKEGDIYKLIFKPGFSTAESVTNVSGRGVGMDVVRSAIESLNGTIEIESKPEAGTLILLKLPLTLAIIEGLIVRIDESYFAIPLSFVEECIELTPETRKKSHGRNLINVRGEIVPYIPLRNNFQLFQKPPQIEQIVIVKNDKRKTGLVVDEIIGEHQTVIKPLGSYYKNVEVISGATVLGDGTVALILDIPKMILNETKNEELKIKYDDKQK